MFTRISFRSVTAALGMGCLALSLLWLSLAASGSVESASFKEISTIPDPAVSPEGSGQEHEHSEENQAFFQPWHHQGTQAGLDEQGLKDADPLEGPNGWRVSFPFTRFFQVEFTERLLVAPFKGKGNLGFGRAP
jgi:hypothetical protein